MDRQSDELIRQILVAAARLAGGRAASVISSATAEAEEEVRALVKSAVKAALLQRVSEQLQMGQTDTIDAPETPAPPDNGKTEIASKTDIALGLYVYCIARSDGATLPMATSIDPPYPLRLLKHGELAAVVSDVPLETFRRRVESEKDLRWLEEKVTAHNHVVQQVAASGPVIPLQFATILRSQQHFVELLDQNRGELRRTLDMFDGQTEWGVKVLAQHSANENGHKLEIDEDAPASGTAYMTRKQKARSRQQQTRGAWRELAQQCHDRLSELASDARLLQNSSRSANSSSNNGGDLLLNASYLVRDARRGQFKALTEQLRRMVQEQALLLQMTGPWPPYNFVNLSFVATKGGADEQ